jgi:hypothetical protein
MASDRYPCHACGRMLVPSLPAEAGSLPAPPVPVGDTNTPVVSTDALRSHLLRQTLQALADHVGYVDNGHCAICGGHRVWLKPGKVAGPCEDAECLSHQIAAALRSPSPEPPASDVRDGLDGIVKAARRAADVFRDAVREGRRIDFRERDPLVMAIHKALDTVAVLRQPVSPAPESREALVDALESLIPIADRMLALLDRGETVCFDNYADQDDAIRYAAAIDKARAALHAPAGGRAYLR